ncbi:MAG: ECF-type sigma factor [Rubrivivax sp.]|nr:ECF-type sigma factor [Rubrivivax sp.]
MPVPVPVDPTLDPNRLWDGACYAELKKIARARLSSAGSLTQMSTTVLVNESYLKLAARVQQLDFASRGHFFAYAAKVMRSVIVDQVRERQAERRGGGLQRVTLDTAVSDSVPAESEPLQVDAALQALEQVDLRLAQVVEMRYYAGMTEAEIGEVLGLTERTVRRDWGKARAILKTMLGP